MARNGSRTYTAAAATPKRPLDDLGSESRRGDDRDRGEHERHRDGEGPTGRLRRRDERDDDDLGRTERADGYALTAAELRYQAIVLSSPARSDVCASNPNRSRAREASRLRRGWPFGIDVSQTISPVEAGQFGNRLGDLANRGLDTRADVHRRRLVVAFGGEHERLGAVVDVQKLPRR